MTTPFRIKVQTRPGEDLDVLAFATVDRRSVDLADTLTGWYGGAIAERLREFDRLADIPATGFEATFVQAPLSVPWLMPIGIGNGMAFDSVTAVRLGAAISRSLRGLRVRRLGVWLRNDLGTDLPVAEAAELVTRGIVEGSYDPKLIYGAIDRDANVGPAEVVIIAPGADETELTKRAERGVVIGEGTNVARDLAQRSANDLTPLALAAKAASLAEACGLEIEVISQQSAAKLGMSLLEAVARGSDNPGCLLILRNGREKERDRLGRSLALVGKGVTFDSGGLNLKTGDRMARMKMDKSGAAAVIAALVTAKTLAPELPLTGYAPLVENMPGPHSARPGDVVRAMNGMLVEIQDTDAEGRLILGDAMTYAQQHGATHLVDVATLTGEVRSALGKNVTGGFGDPTDWWETVVAAGLRQGERYWRLPLVHDERRDLDSWYADIRNMPSPEGALVKSALFLQSFVGVPWVHLDIAGTAWLDRATAWGAAGSTGVAHATLVELALEGA